MNILEIAGTLTTIVGLVALIYGLFWLIDYARWRREFYRSKREELKESLLEGWNTGEPPEDVPIVVKTTLEHRPFSAVRYGDDIHGGDYVARVENCIAWTCLPEKEDESNKAI